jgi:hypothetical protein
MLTRRDALLGLGVGASSLVAGSVAAEETKTIDSETEGIEPTYDFEESRRIQKDSNIVAATPGWKAVFSAVTRLFTQEVAVWATVRNESGLLDLCGFIVSYEGPLARADRYSNFVGYLEPSADSSEENLALLFKRSSVRTRLDARRTEVESLAKATSRLPGDGSSLQFRVPEWLRRGEKI